MGYRKGNDVYRHNQILSASPKRLIELLIEGGIKKLKLAELALAKNDFEEVNLELIKAQNIILELKQAVDPTIDEEVGRQFIQMYDFMFEKLVEANISKDLEKITLVSEMLGELGEAWAAL